jgi:hypothetical protein
MRCECEKQIGPVLVKATGPLMRVLLSSRKRNGKPNSRFRSPTKAESETRLTCDRTTVLSRGVQIRPQGAGHIAPARECSGTVRCNFPAVRMKQRTLCRPADPGITTAPTVSNTFARVGRCLFEIETLTDFPSKACHTERASRLGGRAQTVGSGRAQTGEQDCG